MELSCSRLERLGFRVGPVGVPKNGLRLGVKRWPWSWALHPNGLHNTLVVEDPLVVLGRPDGVALALAFALLPQGEVCLVMGPPLPPAR